MFEGVFGTVLDFGCGTGGVISRLPADRRIGVELGEMAAQEARTKGIEVVSSLGEVAPDSTDWAISFHALEHVDDDLATMRAIYKTLRPAGRIRLIVPGELPIGRDKAWKANADMHLRTWTPLSFGNLAQRAGFSEIRTKFEPPVSGGRGVKIFGKLWRYYLGFRYNRFDVILDAIK